MATTDDQQLSALERFLKTGKPDDLDYPERLIDLTLHILHNLQYQHRWTQLEIHTQSKNGGKRFPRPLISGLPPKRLYVHPDEQAEIIRDESRRRQQRSSLEDDGPSALERPEIEWVLPSHLKESWTLKMFAEVFDAMDEPEGAGTKKWTVHKRMVMSIVQDDSTIVYYIMNDGVVKPRQN